MSDKESRVLFISPWDTEGGIATYSQYLAPQLAGLLDVEVFPWDTESMYARGVGIPVLDSALIKEIRQSDIVHIQYTCTLYLLSFPLILILCKLLRKKVVITQHEVFKNFPAQSLVYIYHQMLYFFVDQMIVHTEYRKNYVHSVHHHRITVIEHGVINREGIDSEPSRIESILFPGAIRSVKGHGAVIGSLKYVEKLSLSIVGPIDNEDYYDEMVDFAERTGVDERVQWETEFIPEEELFNEIRDADLVILPYEPDSTMSGIFCHCISWQTPTLVTDCPAFRQMTSCEHVFLSGRSSEAIAQDIQKIRSDEDRQRKIISEFERLSEKYSWENTAERTSEFYTKLLAN